jgi:hypothetical protein
MSLLRQDVYLDSLCTPLSHSDFQTSVYWGLGIHVGKLSQLPYFPLACAKTIKVLGNRSLHLQHLTMHTHLLLLGQATTWPLHSQRLNPNRNDKRRAFLRR